MSYPWPGEWLELHKEDYAVSPENLEECRWVGLLEDYVRTMLAEAGDSLDPVSYTHLDVYKRQLLSCMCVLICITISAMAAFVIHRRKTMLHTAVFYLFFAGLIAPMNYITTLQILKRVHLSGTYTGIIIVYAAMGIPFAAFLFYNFMSNIPVELDEASVIDGAGTGRLFFQVIFPLLRPITITASTLTFISSWNDFITPLYILNSSKKWGMILTVYNYWGFLSQDWGKICAVIVLTLMPILILYICMQKYIIAGMASGAVKG